MLKNYIKIAVRNLLRNKGFSIINISGLAIGMASALLILSWVRDEWTFDRFYAKKDRIYRMYVRVKSGGTLLTGEQTPMVLGPALKHDLPEVEDAVRYDETTFLLTGGQKHFNVKGAFADTGFLSLFDFPLVEGNAGEALQKGNGIILTQKLANKLFGSEEVLGKTVRIDSNANFTVTGVLRDLPGNTSFDFEYLLPWDFMRRLGWEDRNWTNNFAYTYVLLKTNALQSVFDAKVRDVIIQHTKGSAGESKTTLFTQSLNRSYLYSRSENGQLVAGQIEMVRLFVVIALFILLIACTNFMNLSTARSEKRAKEVGVRKVSGAFRSSLISQFITESIVLSFLAFVLCLLLVRISLPSFNLLVGKSLSIDYRSPGFWVFSLAFVGFTGLLAGSYPAFYLSSFAPVKVLKGNPGFRMRLNVSKQFSRNSFRRAGAAVTSRQILVVLQFTFSILLIICTLIVRDQINYAERRDAGYDKSRLVYSFLQGDAYKNYALIRQDLLSSGAAVSVTNTAMPITERWSSGSGYEWSGSTETDKGIGFIHMGSDADFVKTTGVTLLEGRDIDIYHYPTDSSAMLLNETAVKTMHLKNPVGQVIRRKNYPQVWHVVGVVKDFILESPFENTIQPMVIDGPAYVFGVMQYRLSPSAGTTSSLAKAESIFRQYNPQYPFEYNFADEAYAKKFADVQRTGNLAFLFAGLAILISCLGLFGLAAYMAENRIREIGVRKVLGASVTSITTLLTKDFVRLVLVAFIIAAPIAWFAMHNWLDNFSYHIAIGWTVFAFSGTLAVLIAVLTVSYQSIRAALANPVKSLRTE
ncbi:MAG TPA: ABC transporter permease [Puia sp.]|nr:ABC transporter permease [Puia sp.]